METKWNKLTDIDPPMEERVLVSPLKGYVVISKLTIDYGEKIWEDDSGDGSLYNYETITHWQHLPTAP